MQIGLERQGFWVRCLPSGQQIGQWIDEWQPEVVLLDHRHTQAPIIMLTAKGDVDDRVAGLESGADDYLPKPFALSELVARIIAALRRPKIAGADKYQYADLVVDPRTREVYRGGTSISLTNREFTLLRTLVREPHRVFSKEQLLELVWGQDFDGEIVVVETYNSYLRARPVRSGGGAGEALPSLVEDGNGDARVFLRPAIVSAASWGAACFTVSENAVLITSSIAPCSRVSLTRPVQNDHAIAATEKVVAISIHTAR